LTSYTTVLFCSHASRRPDRDFSFGLLPAELRYGPAESIGDVLAKGEYMLLRCGGCRHVAVLHLAVMARLVEYDYQLNDSWQEVRGEARQDRRSRARRTIIAHREPLRRYLVM
jgi:hypothetical protein